MRRYFVYILRCSDGSYYTGITNNVVHRLLQHAEGIDRGCYTFNRRSITVAYQAEFSEVLNALSWEKTVKEWSRAKKEALIKGDQEALKHFSKRRSGKPPVSH